MIIDDTATFEAVIPYTELMLGCGHVRKKRFKYPDDPEAFSNLITCDINPAVNPDVVHDLNELPWPFQDEEFDEVHAYEVLEHLGSQGDYKAFFAHFDEIYRILKPGGKLYASVPLWHSAWAWGDPGHTRVINEGTLIFLNRENYDDTGQTPITDYRHIYKGDFEVVTMQEAEANAQLYFVLRKK